MDIRSTDLGLREVDLIYGSVTIKSIIFGLYDD